MQAWGLFCVDSSYPAVSGLKSRLADSLEILGGVIFKGCLDWDSFATFLRLFSDADDQVRKRRDSCVDASDRAVLGSKSRLWDSLETLGGMTLNSAPADTTERGCTMAGSQLSRDFVLLLLEE